MFLARGCLYFPKEAEEGDIDREESHSLTLAGAAKKHHRQNCDSDMFLEESQEFWVTVWQTSAGLTAFQCPLGLTLASIQSNSGQLFYRQCCPSPCSQNSYVHPVRTNLAEYQGFEKATLLPSYLCGHGVV